MTPEQKTTALFGGKLITVAFEPVADLAAESGVRETPPEQIKVRQIRIVDFKQGEKLLNDDEIEFVAFLVNRPREFIVGKPAKKDDAGNVTAPEIPAITAESYEAILATGKEVNAAGFFFFCQRRMELELARNGQAMAAMVAHLPAAQLAQIQSLSTLPTSLPKPPLRPR